MPEGRSRGRRGHGGNDRGNSRRRHAAPVEPRPMLPVDDLPLDEIYATPAEGEPGAEGSVDLNSLYKMGNQQVADAAKQLAIEGATSHSEVMLLSRSYVMIRAWRDCGGGLGTFCSPSSGMMGMSWGCGSSSCIKHQSVSADQKGVDTQKES